MEQATFFKVAADCRRCPAKVFGSDEVIQRIARGDRDLPALSR